MGRKLSDDLLQLFQSSTHHVAAASAEEAKRVTGRTDEPEEIVPGLWGWQNGVRFVVRNRERPAGAGE